MAKRGYKLQEFVAHSGNVNCLRIGKKTCRKFLTGGDDHVVNLWSVGKPEPLTSLNGHSSPIESVAFDSAEVLAVAGASSGVIKLWDLEETKVIHNLTGHRSYCTAVEFHPFGEFLASGSMDTNLKIWDIRKKGCTHTYKGHSRGISTMKFTPDGRWVVSGGLDHVVKVWDLTAGKLLHDFKLHQGHIRSLEFHPFEFLLATGSADRTIKFWDLETFEMISSTKCETAGVRSMKFHPDGTRLFCALDGSLKVYSWEPAICHDSVDMGWSTIGDLCVHDGKLLGGAYYENSVGVWVVDMSVVQLNGGSIVPEQDGQSKKKVELQNIALKKSESHRRSTSDARSTSPDSGFKDIKNRRSTSNARSTSPDTESKDIKNQMSASNARCIPSPDSESKEIQNRMSTSNARSTSPDTESKDIRSRTSASNAQSTSSDSESKDIKNRMSASIARCTPPDTESTDIRNRMSASNARCTPPDTESTDIKNRISASNALCTSSDSESKGIKNRMLASNVRSTSPDSESKDIRNRMSASIARCTPPDTESTNIRNGMSASNARCTPPDAESTDIRGRMSASNARCTSPDTESKDIRDRMPVSNARCTSPDTESKDIRNRMPASNARCTSPDSEPKDIRNRMSVSNARCTSPDTESKDIRNKISTPSNARCTSPDSESTDIKNIYVDSESPVNSKKVESLCSPKVMAPPPGSKEIKSPASQKKQGSRAVLHTKPNESATNKSFVVPIFVPRDNQDAKRDSISTARTNAGTLVRPANLGNNAPTTLPRLANRRKVSATKSDAETVSAAPVSGSFRNTAANTLDYSKRGPISARRPTSTKPEVETVSTPLEYSPSRAKETAMHAKKAHARRPPSTMPAALESGPFGTVNTFDSEEDQNSKSRLMFDNNARDSSEEQDLSIKTVNGKIGKSSPLTKSNLENDAQNEARGVNPTAKVVNGVAVVHGRTRNLVERFEKIEVCSNVEVRSPDTTPQIVRSGEIASTALNNDHPVAGREEDSAQNDILDVQIFMQNHEALLSTFTSRLAKLQMIRLFWERNDVKGAIIAMNKLPDHSVQADVVGVLLERVDVITLDLFSCLLPVLLGLLDAKVERHTSVSLEMLLKLVAVFGQLVRSTVSAPPAVGVDLHAEQRVESCKECFVYLQNVQKILPTLIRRGGVLGRYALELNLLLRQS